MTAVPFLCRGGVLLVVVALLLMPMVGFADDDGGIEAPPADTCKGNATCNDTCGGTAPSCSGGCNTGVNICALCSCTTLTPTTCGCK